MSKIADLQDGDYWNLPWGRLEVHNNELWVISTVNDAPALSLIGPNAKVSFKTPDGAEKVLIEPRTNAKGDGELYFGCYSQARYTAAASGSLGPGYVADALDYAMLEVGTLNPDGLEIRVPIKASAGFTEAPLGDTLIAGSFKAQMQGDGNFVVSKDGVPIWSWLTGAIG